MLKLVYTSTFIRSLQKLEKKLQDEVIEKLELFRNKKNHAQLKLHKLHGAQKHLHAFSVNYATRVIVRFSKENIAVVYVLDVGDHDLYE